MGLVWSYVLIGTIFAKFCITIVSVCLESDDTDGRGRRRGDGASERFTTDINPFSEIRMSFMSHGI